MTNKFLEAQSAGMYKCALKEVKSGEKCSHWMWYIFPQLKGLGHSHSSRKYAINSFDEAKEYMSNFLLKRRLLRITRAVYRLNVENIESVFGYVDTLKLRSCMTLFALTCPEYKIFQKVLNKHFNGEMCEYTLTQFTEGYNFI
jgi:uncharacterized protein (DUF1810 family)